MRSMNKNRQQKTDSARRRLLFDEPAASASSSSVPAVASLAIAGPGAAVGPAGSPASRSVTASSASIGKRAASSALFAYSNEPSTRKRRSREKLRSTGTLLKDDTSLFRTPQKQTKKPSIVQEKLSGRDGLKPKQRKLDDSEGTSESHVATHIHRNCAYFRRGEAKLNATTAACFALVKERFVIPDDFESNRKYGPLSGTSFEERAIGAYNLGLLTPKSPDFEGVEICSNCAVVGHTRNDCPKLI